MDAHRVQEISALLPEQPFGFAAPIMNRESWLRVADGLGAGAIIGKADAALANGLPPQPDSLFLEFSKTGNRNHWQKIASQRRNFHRMNANHTMLGIISRPRHNFRPCN